MRGNRAASRSVWAAACAVALLAPLAAPAQADTAGGESLRPEQWGMDAVGAPEAAERNGGDGVLVALLGTGVDTSHPDLRDGVTAGEDFTEGAASGPGSSGTPLAGIIAGRGHGREYTGGIVGVAPGADLLSLRVAADEGGPATPGALVEAIRHAADEGAQVVALSAAAGAEPDDDVQAAVRYANRTGAVVVAPAGADESAYPGAYDGALAVGAVGEDLALTPDSPSSGANLTAPGAGIRAPAAGGGYTSLDGTGPAAAFVAGAAALLRAEYPRLRPGEVADVLTSSAQAGAEGRGAAGYGAGVLDVAAAVKEGAAAMQGEPLIDPGLAGSAEQESAVPVWALWSGGTLLAVLGAAGCVLVWRRATANPYGLPSREPERARAETRTRSPAGGGAGEPRRAATGHRRAGRRRR
ncbi:S8 family serine peptidase [Streptomonospora litoralis]|uniref:Major intracellular serine protease n=1 Tax=Streptomonospora litoralis TaxID=2498135 RepID=A0A4P6Q0C5_9ACTN|nr:S8 family serine peptidase [Streptomonospora litoralis]QBI52249.1 Major intracellular serine protease precursor [Streptomonospora litoralis]